MIIDTHSHIYDEAFKNDLNEVIVRAQSAGVEQIVLPGIDSTYNEHLFGLARTNPDFFLPMVGLHPTSVNDNKHWREELELLEQLLKNPPVERIYGIGEIGLDLYWSKDWQKEQSEAFVFQMELALNHNLPVVIHTRDAWEQMCQVMEGFRGRGVRAIMHAFAGSEQDYLRLKECGEVVFGIGGVVTYKKSAIAALLPKMNLDDIVLETDAPYLTPAPYRGKRNESSYIIYVRDKIAEIMGVESTEVEARTTANAKQILDL